MPVPQRPDQSFNPVYVPEEVLERVEDMADGGSFEQDYKRALDAATSMEEIAALAGAREIVLGLDGGPDRSPVRELSDAEMAEYHSRIAEAQSAEEVAQIAKDFGQIDQIGR